LADQRNGWFGYDAPAKAKDPAQPRHWEGPPDKGDYHAPIDIDEALKSSDKAIWLWGSVRAHPHVPAFSGGLMDEWPAWAVDALAVCHNEASAIESFLMSQQRGPNG
jgi:hypothetical protein